MSNEIRTQEFPEVSEYTAHAILSYCMTHAVLKNKNNKFKVQIPYAVVAKSCGVTKEEASAFLGVALHLTVTMEWAEHDDDMVELEYE